MDSDNLENLYIERAKNELELAKSIFRLSIDSDLKNEFELKETTTFFSNVINACYYCIFYSAKAFLTKKGIKTEMPDEHRKTLEGFERLANSGEIDLQLLKIYKSIVVKAEELLGIFIKERGKRSQFTYKKLPQANLEPAKESIENAEKFLKNINLIVRRS